VRLPSDDYGPALAALPRARLALGGLQPERGPTPAPVARPVVARPLGYSIADRAWPVRDTQIVKSRDNRRRR